MLIIFISETLASDIYIGEKIHQTLQKWILAKEEIPKQQNMSHSVSLAILMGDSYAAVLMACYPLSGHLIDPPLLSLSRSTHLS